MAQTQREYRELQSFEHKDNFIISGYAATWEPYILYEQDNMRVYEQISKDAFKDADLSDIVLHRDHAGPVYARVSNGTLQVSFDAKGMFVRADLSKTSSARELYEEVKAGLYTKMSWAFTIKDERYDAKTSIRHIDRVSKVYDASVVAHPQNPGTSVNARSVEEWIQGVWVPTVKELNARAALVSEYLRKVANL